MGIEGGEAVEEDRLGEVCEVDDVGVVGGGAVGVVMGRKETRKMELLPGAAVVKVVWLTLGTTRKKVSGLVLEMPRSKLPVGKRWIKVACGWGA